MAKVLTWNPGAASEDGAERCRVGTRQEVGFSCKSCHLPGCTRLCCDCFLTLVLAEGGVLHYPPLRTTQVPCSSQGRRRNAGCVDFFHPIFLSSSPSQVQPNIHSMAFLSHQDTRHNLLTFLGLLCTVKPQISQTLPGHIAHCQGPDSTILSGF